MDMVNILKLLLLLFGVMLLLLLRIATLNGGPRPCLLSILFCHTTLPGIRRGVKIFSPQLRLVKCLKVHSRLLKIAMKET